MARRFDIADSRFELNVADQGAAIYLESGAGLDDLFDASTLRQTCFQGNTDGLGEQYTVRSYPTILWGCNPGHWSPPNGECALPAPHCASALSRPHLDPIATQSINRTSPHADIGDFCGCAFPCAAGFFGDSSDHTIATCAGACAVGHYCAPGSIKNAEDQSITGEPCPPGHSMPATGASDVESCLPCPPGAFQAKAGEINCEAW